MRKTIVHHKLPQVARPMFRGVSSGLDEQFRSARWDFSAIRHQAKRVALTCSQFAMWSMFGIVAEKPSIHRKPQNSRRKYEVIAAKNRPGQHSITTQQSSSSYRQVELVAHTLWLWSATHKRQTLQKWVFGGPKRKKDQKASHTSTPKGSPTNLPLRAQAGRRACRHQPCEPNTQEISG